MKTLLDVCKFLKAAGTYYLATVDGFVYQKLNVSCGFVNDDRVAVAFLK